MLVAYYVLIHSSDNMHTALLVYYVMSIIQREDVLCTY